MKYYTMEVGPHPWGDYGRTLIHGLVDFESGEVHGIPCVMRADSWAPDIAMPLGLLYVTDQIKEAIAREKFNGIEFAPIKITKAVKVGWQSWDRSRDEPEVLPTGGEPENYILKRKHNEKICREIASLWALQAPPIQGGFSKWAGQWADNDPDAPDLASLAGGLGYYASLRFKLLIEKISPGSLRFS